MTLTCCQCGHTIDLGNKPVGRRDTCGRCGRELRCCRHCHFYAPGRENDCAEPQAERVTDKERANFCDYFRPGENPSAGGTGADGGESGASPESVASSLFEGLFSGDTDAVANLVCEEQRDAAVEALGTLGEDTEGVEIDTSGLEFEATEDGDTATVAVSGELSVSIEVEGETIEQASDVSELGGELAEMPMIREDGNWVFCPTDEDAFGG